jgi:DNA-binding MarR family transcriptional regulator
LNSNPKGVPAYVSTLHVKITDFLKKELKEAGYDELVPSYGSVLAVVYQKGGRVQIKEIYDSLAKQKTTITEAINRLVELGYLSKESSEKDQRCTDVVATKKALAFEDDFKRISLEMMAKVYQGFSEEEKRQLPALLVKAIANFD